MIEARTVVIAHGGASFPLGDFRDSHGFGINFGISAGIKAAPKFYPAISIDNHLFFGKKIPGLDEHFKKINSLRIIAAPRITTNGTVGITIIPEAGISLNSYAGESETEFTYGAKVAVPLFKDIPLFAGLFRNGDNTFACAGLMIFITPKIIKSDE